MADVTAILKPAPAENSFQSPVRTDVVVLDFDATGIVDVADQTGTHNIYNIAAGEVLLPSYAIVHTLCVSTSNTGTIQFSMGDALSAAYTADATELAAGDVIQFGANDLEDTAGLASYRTAADTLDIIIATNDFTAGKIVLVLNVLDVAAVLAQGKIK